MALVPGRPPTISSTICPGRATSMSTHVNIVTLLYDPPSFRPTHGFSSKQIRFSASKIFGFFSGRVLIRWGVYLYLSISIFLSLSFYLYLYLYLYIYICICICIYYI